MHYLTYERNDLSSACNTLRIKSNRKETSLFVSPAQEQKLVYHYTTVDTFWKIIESDIFRATHVRFSNDDEEYTQGKVILESITDKAYVDENSHYIICFCADGNLLSQWRGYATGGLSIGMDFSRLQCFSILGNKDPSLIIPALPIEVLYTHGCDGIEKKICSSEIPFCNGNTCSIRIEKCSFENSDGNFSYEDLKNWYKKKADHARKLYFNSIIPYIKHGDFKEERESRLVFPIPKKEEHKYLNYDYNEARRINRPYCKVKFTGIETVESCYIQIGKGVNPNKIAQINHIAKLYNRIIQNELECDNRPEGDCVYISKGKHQEDLFRELDETINGENEETTKIWCDGFWPIRMVLVGPTPKKELIAENIRHYCSNRYWLKYVEVNYTRTPFRE